MIQLLEVAAGLAGILALGLVILTVTDLLLDWAVARCRGYKEEE